MAGAQDIVRLTGPGTLRHVQINRERLRQFKTWDAAAAALLEEFGKDGTWDWVAFVRSIGRAEGGAPIMSERLHVHLKETPRDGWIEILADFERSRCAVWLLHARDRDEAIAAVRGLKLAAERKKFDTIIIQRWAKIILWKREDWG